MKTVFGRKSKSAVSPVIGTILMVAITVVLAAVLYVMVAGLGPGNQPTNVTMILQGSQSAGNFSFSVSSITSSNVDPAQLVYIVEKDGITYYSAGANTSATTSGTTVNVLYSDPVEVGKVSAGDSIRVTVSPTNVLHGGTFKVLYSSAAISTATFP